LAGQAVSEKEVRQALADFDSLWQALGPAEQSRLLQLLIDRVDYNGKEGTIAMTFHTSGIKTLGQQRQNKEAAA
jgi:site-specific DNA recombinase